MPRTQHLPRATVQEWTEGVVISQEAGVLLSVVAGGSSG
jgi:hypothetical protein